MRRHQHSDSGHPSLRIPVAILGGVGFALLLFSRVVPVAVVGAVEGPGFTCLGLAGVIIFGYTWWHRLPVKIKGGLSPDRPFFYHLGLAFLLGTSMLLVIIGASQFKTWVHQ